MTADDVRNLMRREIAKKGTIGAWAREANINAAYVSDVLRGHREPAHKILAALGIERVVTYRRVRA